jgi:DNA-binding CsgD family transcriptional regulator
MMLTLSADQRRGLEEAMHQLLAPLEYASLDEWRAAVNQILKRAFSADAALFMVPTSEGYNSYSESFGRPITEEYPLRVHSLDNLVPVYERAATLGTYTRRTLWGDKLEDYHQSAYYNELVRPHGAASVIAFCVPMEETIEENTVGHIVVSRKENRNPYGTDELARFRLLFPAFRSGLATWLQFHTRREALLRTIDALGAAIWCCDATGSIVHQTPAMTKLLASDPEENTIRAHLQRVARRMARLGQQDDPGDGLSVSVDRMVQTRLASYRVRGARAGKTLADAGAPVLVIADRDPAPLVALEKVQEQFNLTPREVEVTQLLAQRKTNREVAEALCISPHTARHHTEAVLDKLNLHSRTDVRDRIHESIQA